MKKILIICAAAALTGCGIYKPYTRPELSLIHISEPTRP